MKAEIKNDIKQTGKGQTNQYVQKGSSNKVWDFFCSVKLAVVIILVLVVACIIGTVILQEKPLMNMLHGMDMGWRLF